MTYTCPEGHSSAAGDYCDVCGAPIAASSQGGGTGTAVPPLPPPGPGTSGAGYGGYVNPLDLSAPAPADGGPGGPPPTEQACPNCSASNVPGALYCENCGYDFTTGQLPRPLDPPAGMAAAAPSALPPDLLPPAPVPSAPIPSAPVPPVGGDPAAAAPPATDPGGVDAVGPDVAGPDVAPDPVPDAAPDVASAPPTDVLPATSTVPPVTPTSAPGHVEWVAEVWVDPDWYASQDVSEPCPSVGMPAVIPILERTVLIGRQSTSRNIHPQIDLSSDNGVSRRHAQLNSDGQRWWVEDLQSANGTFVGAAGAPVPGNPLPVGQRVELADDDRIFVGAWTRVVVRRATPEESTLGL